VRVMILAAAVLATTTMGAAAAPWSDPAGRLVFDAPSGWIVAPQASDTFTYAVALGNTSECHVFASPRAATASATPDRVRVAGQTQLEPTAWISIASMLPNIFQGDVQVTSQAVDTRPFWPVQTATLRSTNGRNVHAAIQFRPGFELWSFCQTFSGADEVGAFNALAHSVGTPNDVTLQADAERIVRERDAAEAQAVQDRANRIMNSRMEHDQDRVLN
jgi:hypothetical protein